MVEAYHFHYELEDFNQPDSSDECRCRWAKWHERKGSDKCDSKFPQAYQCRTMAGMMQREQLLPSQFFERMEDMDYAQAWEAHSTFLVHYDYPSMSRLGYEDGDENR